MTPRAYSGVRLLIDTQIEELLHHLVDGVGNLGVYREVSLRGGDVEGLVQCVHVRSRNLSLAVGVTRAGSSFATKDGWTLVTVAAVPPVVPVEVCRTCTGLSRLGTRGFLAGGGKRAVRVHIREVVGRGVQPHSVGLQAR